MTTGSGPGSGVGGKAESPRLYAAGPKRRDVSGRGLLCSEFAAHRPEPARRTLAIVVRLFESDTVVTSEGRVLESLNDPPFDGSLIAAVYALLMG